MKGLNRKGKMFSHGIKTASSLPEMTMLSRGEITRETIVDMDEEEEDNYLIYILLRGSCQGTL
jgi:hypothetical protein